MKTKLLQHEKPRIFVAVFETGEEVADGLLRLAREYLITGAGFTAIGAFEDVTLAFFDTHEQEYQEIPINEQVEVLAMVGNIGTQSGEPRFHAHVVVGRRDGTTRGGHFLRAQVRPTLEVVITESPGHLRRTKDAATGLLLIDAAH